MNRFYASVFSLVFALSFAFSASADPLFHCTVTRVLDPAVLGEALDTADYSDVAGFTQPSETGSIQTLNQTRNQTIVQLGAMVFIDGEYDFSISKTRESADDTVFTIAHPAGLNFIVHLGPVSTGEGSLSVQGKGDPSELVYALLSCDR